jgi:hypothetical protein
MDLETGAVAETRPQRRALLIRARRFDEPRRSPYRRGTIEKQAAVVIGDAIMSAVKTIREGWA